MEVHIHVFQYRQYMEMGGKWRYISTYSNIGNIWRWVVNGGTYSRILISAIDGDEWSMVVHIHVFQYRQQIEMSGQWRYIPTYSSNIGNR
jgi:hypothetical protein